MTRKKLRSVGAVYVVAAALLAGCSAESTAPEDGEVFAGAACMNFVEVYVGASTGEVSPGAAVEKIKQARDLAEAAATRDSAYDLLAGYLALMHDAMGTDDVALESSLLGVQGECEPLLPD